MTILGEAVAIEGRHRIVKVDGALNVTPAQRAANVTGAIRRGLPQFRAYAPHDQVIALVGSGPSLQDPQVLAELRDLHWGGVKLVAMNGSYQWLIAHNLRPSALVVIDSRPFNARFLTEPVPGCRYYIASQCASELFDRLQAWPDADVVLWHCFTGEDPDEKALLDGYYLNQWQAVAGGSTVGLRAIVLFSLLGFRRMHLFGMDSCYLDAVGHAVAQPENDHDDRQTIDCAGRTFTCSSWHCSQALEFIDLIATNGEKFELSVHGDGLLAHMVRVGASAGDEVAAQLKE